VGAGSLCRAGFIPQHFNMVIFGTVLKIERGTEFFTTHYLGVSEYNKNLKIFSFNSEFEK